MCYYLTIDKVMNMTVTNAIHCTLHIGTYTKYFMYVQWFTHIRSVGVKIQAYWGLVPFSSVQSLSRVRLFATPWTAAHQASLSITNSRSSLKLTSIESVMPSSHLILCRPLFLLPPIPPSRVKKIKTKREKVSFSRFNLIGIFLNKELISLTYAVFLDLWCRTVLHCLTLCWVCQDSWDL